jgi:predicted DNA-binding transcriptional regulator AlpA
MNPHKPRGATTMNKTEPKRIRLLSLKEVSAKVGVSDTTLYLWIGKGRFPRPVLTTGLSKELREGLGEHTRVAWVESEIEAFMSPEVGGMARRQYPVLSTAKTKEGEQ